MFPKWRKHSLISIENKSVEISKSIPCCTEVMAINALFNASKWREFVTMVSLLLRAPVFTNKVSSFFKVSIPIFCFADNSSAFGISVVSVAISSFDK